MNVIKKAYCLKLTIKHALECLTHNDKSKFELFVILKGKLISKICPRVCCIILVGKRTHMRMY